MTTLFGVLALIGRLLIVAIFLLAAVGQKIPKFSDTAAYMASEGVPVPKVMLVGAILFLIAGGLSVAAGFKARIGATLLLIFLLSAVGKKIPDFSETAAYMAFEGVPIPKIMLGGAIVFLIAGSLSIRQVNLVERETLLIDELREPVAFELDAVVLVEVVETDDLVTTAQQGLTEVIADETGRSSDQALAHG